MNDSNGPNGPSGPSGSNGPSGRQTISAVTAAVIAADPARPLLTFYDDGTGERTELSGATLMNWIAKTANMLTDDCALGVGDRASVALPPHWQTAAVLLGCWTTGLRVTVEPEPAEVAFVHIDWATAEWPSSDRYALGLHPLALPLSPVPVGYLDFTTEVRAHGDFFSPPQEVSPDDRAFTRADSSGARRDYTNAEILAVARERAEKLGLTPDSTGLASGGRIMIDVGTHPDPVDWLLAPITAGASIVLCRNLDLAKADARAEAERVTHRPA